MQQAVQMCKEKLQLSELTVKANISDDRIENSCQRLLQLAASKPYNPDSDSDTGRPGEELELKGHRLCLANSYSVSSDGELKIPWDFKLA